MSRLNSKIIFYIILFVLTMASPILAWTGRVVGVSDGDTIKVLTEDKQIVKIRLYGIDCPEKRQAFGKRAKWFCSDLIFGRQVEVEPIAKDRWGRTVALIYQGSLCLNEKMVASGFAWVFPKYCKKPICQKWYRLQKEARKARIGLWKDSRPISPWVWRKKSKSRR